MLKEKLTSGICVILPTALLCSVMLWSCSQNNSERSGNSKLEKGIGPIQNLKLGPIDESMAEAGRAIYDSKCTACHNPTEKLIGPPQAGVMQRRSPEWVMNLLLNTDEMLDKDPIANAMLKEYNNVRMTNQNLTEQEARRILEYLRTI